jgi:dienelactone hydrolase
LATPDPAKAHKDAGILYVPDVIGIWQNSKLMADQYAANGYLTLIIDVFNGDPLPLNRPDDLDFSAWLEKGSNGDNPHTKETIDPIVVEAIKWLQTEKGVKKLGAVGYCFGAKVCYVYMR